MALRKVKAVLIDLSGTLHIESSPITGAVEALKRLREKNVIVRFVTNTTKESKRILYEKLLSMGFQLQQNEIFTSLVAARQYVDSKQVRPLLLLENEALEDFQGVHTHNPNAVVIGLAPNRFDYKTMNEAFRLLLEGASLIAVHKSRYYQCKDGLSLGPGPFVTALEYATDLKAVVVGKPEPRFFLSAIDGLGCQPDETLMIGDDVRDDIGGAQAIGMVGILVKTGKYRNGDEHKLNSSPNLVHENFPDAVNFILNNMV